MKINNAYLNSPFFQVTLMWFIGGIFGALGSLTAGLVFKRFITRPSCKLVYAFIATTGCAICAFWLPRITSFPVLVATFSVRYFCKQLWLTASLGFLVHLMGPKRSQAFVMGHGFTQVRIFD